MECDVSSSIWLLVRKNVGHFHGNILLQDDSMQPWDSDIPSDGYCVVAMPLFLYKCPGKSIAELLMKKDWR